MADLFDESVELRKITDLSQEIRRLCVETMKKQQQGTKRTTPDGRPMFNPDPEGDRRRVILAMNWPGDELVQQIIKDTVSLMVKHDIQPKQVK